MKTSDVLLYGLIAFGAYELLIKPKPTQTITVGPGGVVTPGVTVNTGTSNPVASVITTAGSLFSKLFPASTANTPAAASPAATAPGTNFSQEINNLFTPAPLTPAPLSLTSAAPVSSGLVQEDTSSLFTDNSPFTSDTEYLMSLEEA